MIFRRQEYESKLNDLKSATKDLYGRVYEMLERPAAVEALNSMLNHTAYFLFGMKNFTGEDQPFAQADYDALEKLVIDTVVCFAVYKVGSVADLIFSGVF